ncbi:conserved oligomeric Golgi complex subunit 7 isoform X1 [Fopius arisanus]|uniref:Conserved oligomeric Golgi complex subunit 7 n=3 Tax=Fopius arisanus TaxID=64838 RepID=A0A9R1SXR6_9HYME|nr:PREDICTED: conserved oligomeric Golgi complex subunit 7 isoform X1 [Fopius arisanus]
MVSASPKRKKKRGNNDVSAFSEKDFDVKEWINKTFKSTEELEDKDAFVSSLVMKLQLYVQQVNGSLEETSQSVLSSLPRILRDTQLLQQEALALKDKMATVKQEIAKVEKDTALSMTALEKMARVKTELQVAKQSLHEADNWSVLANDLEEVFESGDIEKIGGKVFSMQKSLSMLANAVDYEDKKLQLEGLKNRLEAMASPKLVQAFTIRNLDESKIYVNIFSKMDRLPQLLKYYQNCLKVSLCEEWRKIREVSMEDNVTSWLNTFYDKLLLEWQDQVKWCNQVFSTSSTVTLIDIYADVLCSLDPSIHDTITGALKYLSPPLQLDLLIELKKITQNFARNLNASLEISPIHLKSEDKLLALAQSIYSPYVVPVSKYSTYESGQLSENLSSIETNHESLSDTINSLSLSVSRAIDHANQANKRCKLFTESCGYPGLLKSLNTYFLQYLDRFISCMKQLEKRKTKHDDWNLFQMCLTLMQIIGDFLVQIEEFEKTLVVSIVEASNKLQSGTAGSFSKFKILLLTPNGRQEFDKLVKSLNQNEEKTLLASVIESIYKLCADLHHTTYEVIFAPIFTQLVLIQRAPAWFGDGAKVQGLSSDLPDYSFAPQEYITQVGQYLMTLPQHLEPFLLRDNPSLVHALRAADAQYTQGSAEGGFTATLLGIVAKGTCQMFQDQALGICELNTGACKQLATDIDYLGNVLEELGLPLSDNLQQMSTLLRLSPEDYQSGSSGCNARIVAAVRQMRNIASSG